MTVETFEVGIIGAGIHGASAAFHLASAAVPTVVFEKGSPASGPTGRSSAVCRSNYTNEFLAGVARDSISMFESFAEITNGRDAGFRQTGFLFLHPESDIDQLEAVSPRLREQGIVNEVLTLDDLAADFPQFDLTGVGVGAWEPRSGYADPAGTTQGMFDRAVELGMTPRLDTEIVAIEQRPGGGAIVVAGDGSRTACERLLIAAGPWTKPLAAMVGADLPLVVERHIVATYGWGGAEELPFGFADLIGGYYQKPEGEGLYCLGPLPEGEVVDPDDFDREITDTESIELAEAVIRRLPALADSDARGGWASLYDVSPDWQPVIGPIGDGIFVDAGTSGHGFKLAPALGRYVADLVTGKPADPGLAQFDPSRFAAGRSLSGGYGDVRILG